MVFGLTGLSAACLSWFLVVAERVLELSEIKFVWFLRSWLKIPVPSIISLFSWQNAVSLSPSSFRFPIPGVYFSFFHFLFVLSFLLML